MKAHTILTTLGCLMVSALLANAQDAAPTEAAPESQPAIAADTAAPPATEAQPAEVQPALAEAQPAPAEAADAQAADAQPVEVAATDVAAPETQPPTAESAQPETATGDAMAVTDTNVTTAPVEAPATSEAATNVVIPLIVIDDTPLLDAIRNLARQAGINLMIDPKVAYGQPGPDGKPTPQPNVSIRWENITAAQAFNALLNNYDLQAIEVPKVNITRITTKDPAAPDPLITKTIQLQYASPTNVMIAVTAAFKDKRSKIVPDTRTSQLVVVTTEKEMVDVESLIKELDTPTKQVLIEARLVETTMNPSTVKGIDWSGTLKAQHVVFGNNALPGVAPTPPTTANDANGNPVAVPGTPGTIGGILSNPKLLMSPSAGSFFSPATAFLNADGVSAVLSFLNTSTDAKILSSPRTVTLDNETAHIEVGTLYPVINVTAGTANTTGGSQVNYSNLTVRLDVTPRISANDSINLKVSPRVMRLDHVQNFSVGGQSFDVPVFATRDIDTSVLIPSGNTLVMGGLIQDNLTKGYTKVPVLGDIPGLGLLFRQESKDRQKGNLIVFITPTIVQDDDFQPTKSEYLKTPMPASDFGEPDWSAWDSGKPYDWSKRNGSTVE